MAVRSPLRLGRQGFDELRRRRQGTVVRIVERFLQGDLARPGAGSPTYEEARWERAIWREWHEAVEREFIPTVCRTILSYQVMLRDRNSDVGWGEIDLLGQSSDGDPVVIELKGPSSHETPLRGIAEGVAYAIAIGEAWAPCFGQQWCARLQIDATVVKPHIRTVFAAPADYWDRVTGQQGPRWRVSKLAWQAIGRLVDALAARGWPVSLVRLAAEDMRAPRHIHGTVLDVATFG